MICPLCEETVEPGAATFVLYIETGPQQAHKECMLREVMGGIGHHIAHEYWCAKGDPDAGLTRHQSALLVLRLVELLGSDVVAERAVVSPPPI